MVKQIEQAGEQIIRAGNGALVLSKSQPNQWHIVRDDACDCRGYQFRGDCRHIRAVHLANTPVRVVTNGAAALESIRMLCD